MISGKDEEQKLAALQELYPDGRATRATVLPTQEEVYALCGTTRAKVRRAAGVPPGRSHGNQIGLDEERTLLASFAREANAQGHCALKCDLEVLLRQFFVIRHEEKGTPLNHKEMAFMNDPNHHLHPKFWAGFFAEHHLTRSAIRIKNSYRIEAYTLSAVNNWSTLLWQVLEKEGFLYQSGGRRGQVRDECKYMGVVCRGR